MKTSKSTFIFKDADILIKEVVIYPHCYITSNSYINWNNRTEKEEMMMPAINKIAVYNRNR
jgi:hypothetical protein